MNKEKKLGLDKTIKDYIRKIRKTRDCLFEKGKLPREARVELSNYRPMLWTRRRPRRINN